MTKQMAEEINRVRQHLADGDADGWTSRDDEKAAVQTLYDLLIRNAQMKADRNGIRGDSAEMEVTLDPEMFTLLQRLSNLDQKGGA